MRAKFFHLFAASALAVALFAGEVAAQETIKVGLVMPLTGVLGPVGKQAVAGARLYMAQHGDMVAGRKIELVVRDDASVPDNSKRITQELIVSDKVAILGGGLTPNVLAIAPLVNESKTATVFLELDDVEAERQPGVAWQVYLGLPANAKPTEASPHYVGALALFGQGIHSESHDKFEPAHFAFPVNRALLAGFKANQEHWTITFVPRGILLDGTESQPKVESPVKIAHVSLTVETQKPGRRPE